MKRLVVGMLLAAVAWMIGSQFHPWYTKWLGLAFGFLFGLIFEDWQVTKEVVDRWRKELKVREWDWKGALTHMGTSFCITVSLAGWVVLLVLLGCLTDDDESFAESFKFGSYVSIALAAFGLVYSWIVANFISEYREYCHDMNKIRSFSRKSLKLCLKWNPVSVFGFWPFYILIRFVIPFVREIVSEVPAVAKKFGQLLFYSLIELAAREKTLTFAICVTTGAGVGMLMGRTIGCGLSASLLAVSLIFISDKTRELAQQKLALLKQKV